MRFNVLFITLCVFHVDIQLMIGGYFIFQNNFFVGERSAIFSKEKIKWESLTLEADLIEVGLNFL